MDTSPGNTVLLAASRIFFIPSTLRCWRPWAINTASCFHVRDIMYANGCCFTAIISLSLFLKFLHRISLSPFPSPSPKVYVRVYHTFWVYHSEISVVVLSSWCPTDHKKSYWWGAHQFLTLGLCSGLEIAFIVLLTCLGVLPMYLYLAFDSWMSLLNSVWQDTDFPSVMV